MNNVLRPLMVGLIMGVALNSCTYPRQVIRLNPAPFNTPAVSAASVADHTVVLVTRDMRSVQEIGRRRSGSPDEAAITTDTDIPGLLRVQMTDILKAKGYFVLAEGSSSTAPTLEVQLKELSYVAFEASGQRKVKIQVLLATQIKNGSGSFQKTFQAQEERRVVFEPVAKSNEEWINETFADALKEVANDTGLYTHLN